MLSHTYRIRDLHLMTRFRYSRYSLTRSKALGVTTCSILLGSLSSPIPLCLYTGDVP